MLLLILNIAYVLCVLSCICIVGADPDLRTSSDRATADVVIAWSRVPERAADHALVKEWFQKAREGKERERKQREKEERRKCNTHIQHTLKRNIHATCQILLY